MSGWVEGASRQSAAAVGSWGLRRQIAATDREIDGLVYGLYGLTEAEIAIVEGAYP